MARCTLPGLVGAALLAATVCCHSAQALETPRATPQVQEQAPEGFFLYPLRAGESLGDVARIFRVSVDELLQVNRIADPSRLPIGYALKIPNAFARQITELQQERNRLAAAQDQLRAEAEQRQQSIATLLDEVRKLEQENAFWTARQTMTGWWRLAALVLAGGLLLSLGWGWFLHRNRNALSKSMASLLKNNEALTIAKDKYRQAAAQLELRYQKLYRLGEANPAKVAQGGIAFVEKAFNEGSAQMERILAAIQREQEKTNPPPPAMETGESFSRSWRGFWQRHRLKYREA